MALAVPRAEAADSASLQFTVPAPDPIQAGEVIALQALAVNTGGEDWPGGSYYWVAEIYDLDYKLVARTDQVSPTEEVRRGNVAPVSIPFRVPDTLEGRRLYRVFLFKDNQKLVESEYKGFQIIENPIPPPPELVDYRLEGNVTVSYKNASRNKWKQHAGATTINAVGKLKDSSYLINTYFLHEPGKAFDPFIIVLNYYAPWGTVYAGDVSPNLNPLSVAGQGMRGGMLEQTRGRFSWTVLGGQTVYSQNGTSTTNGRYARSMYGLKGLMDLGWNLKAGLNYFLSGDETGSLSTDPKSSNFRGPSLLPQKNSGMGLDLLWEPRPKLKVLLAYQKNKFQTDTKAAASDNAWRGELQWERKVFKWKTFLQRAGPKYVAFGAPGVVGDRQTFDTNLGLYPANWYSLALALNQYSDNLAGDPRKVTTTQRVMNMGHSFQVPKTATSLNLNMTLNTAKGKPSTALDNQTTTIGFGLGQPFKGHSVSLGVQMSQFKDKNRLAHDLDTQTLTLGSNWSLAKSRSLSVGLSNSQAKDKFDGSKRTTQSLSPSFTTPVRRGWIGQFFGSYTGSKNTSPLFPTDTTTISVNSEFTKAVMRQASFTFGVGANQVKDKIQTSRTLKEMTMSLRYSYSF